MSAKRIDETVWNVPEVIQAEERAKRRGRESGEGWGVWVDPACWTRTWTSPTEEAPPPGICVFTTEDGRLV